MQSGSHCVFQRSCYSEGFCIKILLFFSAAVFLLFIIFDVQQINKNELCFQHLPGLIPFGRSVPWSTGQWASFLHTDPLLQSTVCDRCLLRLVFRAHSALFLGPGSGREIREKTWGDGAEYIFFAAVFPGVSLPAQVRPWKCKHEEQPQSRSHSV